MTRPTTSLDNTLRVTIACYRINPKLKVAVEGYAFKQTTDDKVNGSDIGFKGQAFALGQAFNMPIRIGLLKPNF